MSEHRSGGEPALDPASEPLMMPGEDASRKERKVALPRTTLIGGLTLAVLAMVIYLLPGELGAQAVAYTVLGLAVGTVVALMPGASPVAKLLGFLAGLVLAFASFFVRGGLLPYTNEWSAVVVLLMLLIITGIGALLRSGTLLVSMLLGAGTLYGVLELQFQALPAAYLDTSVLALLAILFSVGIGYLVSILLGLDLAPGVDARARHNVVAGQPRPKN